MWTRCIDCGETDRVYGFSFEAAYGEPGDSCIEVHHLIPLAELATRPRRVILDPRTPRTAHCPRDHRSAISTPVVTRSVRAPLNGVAHDRLEHFPEPSVTSPSTTCLVVVHLVCPESRPVVASARRSWVVAWDGHLRQSCRWPSRCRGCNHWRRLTVPPGSRLPEPFADLPASLPQFRGRWPTGWGSSGTRGPLLVARCRRPNRPRSG